MKKIKTIVIVDDDLVSSFLIAATLEELGVANQIAKVYNGRQALDFLKNKFHTNAAAREENSHALLLLDLNMPVMNGFEFLDEFTAYYSALQRQITICILTSSVSSKDIARAKQYDIAGFITKPLTEANLLPILAKLELPG